MKGRRWTPLLFPLMFTVLVSQLILLCMSSPCAAAASTTRTVVDQAGRRVEIPSVVNRVAVPLPWMLNIVTAIRARDKVVGVSVSGLIGWVGLVIPHMGRMMVGADHRVLLPACLALGAAYLPLVDDLARALTTGEIPLGILTALVGAPFFAYLLRKTRGGWS